MITEIMHIDNEFDDLSNSNRKKQRHRKNFVLIESSHGAKASAILFNLSETAKANGINIYEYFNLLLTEIPEYQNDTNLDLLDKLLPWSPNVPAS